MLHDCNSNIQEAEEGVSVFQKQSEVHSETVSKSQRVGFLGQW